MIRLQDPENAAVLAAVQAVIDRLYASSLNDSYRYSAEGASDIANHTWRRYEICANHIVPWVERCRALEGLEVAEMGCGTGSSTAAFAQRAARVRGYDISPSGVQIAAERCAAMGLHNVEVKCVEASQLLAMVERDHSAGCDVFVLFAVLEHLTIPERIATIRAAWNLLRPSGLLVIGECPNRITYWDHHTSLLPFFHFLPDELAFAYADRSPRPILPALIGADRPRPAAEAAEMRIRAGIGASYHEFEIALGLEYAQHLVADGYEPEISSWFGSSVEERLAQTYFLEQALRVPLGFSRGMLNLIFQRPPLSSVPRGLCTGAEPGERAAVVTNLERLAREHR